MYDRKALLRASVAQLYCRLPVFTICSSVPVVALCLPVTSACSSTLLECSGPPEMSDKCRGGRLTTRWGMSMPVTTPYAVWRGYAAYFIFLGLETAEALLTQSRCNSVDVRCSWCFIQSLYPESWFLSLCFLPPLPPSQGEYMSQQLLRPRRVSCEELHRLGVLRVRGRLEGGSLRRPRLPGRLRRPWQRPLPEQDVRLQGQMARWAGTAAASLGCQRPHCLAHFAVLNKHGVIRLAPADPYMPKTPRWLKWAALCRVNSGSGPSSGGQIINLAAKNSHNY